MPACSLSIIPRYVYIFVRPYNTHFWAYVGRRTMYGLGVIGWARVETVGAGYKCYSKVVISGK